MSRSTVKRESNGRIRIVGALVVVFLLFAIVFLFEKIAEWKNIKPTPPLTSQVIRLRQHPENISTWVKPSKSDLRAAENLEEKLYRVRLDPHGFISSTVQYDDPKLSIYFLGGSTTEVMYVTEEMRFPSLARDLLEKATGQKINSYNAGVSGNNTMHDLDILIHRIFPLHPQFVVLMENINDLATLAHFGSYWNESPTRSLIVAPREPQSLSEILLLGLKTVIPNLYSIVRSIYQLHSRYPAQATDEFYAVRDKKVVLSKTFFQDEFQRSLQTFVSICKARGIIPVLMTQENRFKAEPDPLILARLEQQTKNVVSYKEFKNLYDSFNEIIRQVARKNDLVLVDLAKEIPKSSVYIYDFVHMNDQGSQLAARVITQKLTPLILRYSAQ